MNNNNYLMKTTINKVLDQVFLCSNNHNFSYFIDSNIAKLAIDVVKKEHKNIEFKIFGGLLTEEQANLERVIIGVSEKKINFNDFPITAIKFIYDKYGEPNHRHILGTILGNGIDRNRIGDILIFEDYCVIFIHKSIENTIISIDRIGKYSVSAEKVNTDDLFIPMQKYVEKSSSKIDSKLTSIIAFAFNVSKTTARDFLKNNKIKINGSEVKKDINIVETHTITVRSLGRVIIKEIGTIIKIHIYK
ncbi:MAG: YlmH/Sll1252 family protein [Defluviitaleaceae bacterium]|nr:YlmH/Sll1252 family protein [Defluviitaleaceae bacterium]